MVNKRFLDTAEKRTNFLIAVIGCLLIVIAAILVLLNQNFIVNALATISGSVGGVLIGTGITGYINLDPLQKVCNSLDTLNKTVKDELEQIQKNIKEDLTNINQKQTNLIENLCDKQTDLIDFFYNNIRISCGNNSASKNRLERIANKEKYYRYFQTLNSDGNWEWRMKPLSFRLDDDGKRVIASIEYKHNHKTSYSYNIQASYLGTHFVLFAEECKQLDNPIVEIYPALINFGREHIFSGISIRYPWDRRNNLLITLCILSDHEILKEQWKARFGDISESSTIA